MIRWSHELETVTASAEGGGHQEANAGNGMVTEAQQDVLQLVTSASVYLCKVRDSLCDKLAPWGYMSKSVNYLREVLICELFGSPLLSIMRILHVASNRLVNVEALALVGDSDGRSGVVHYTIEAINGYPLHNDTAFMVDVLLKIFREALGDVKKAAKGGQTSAVASNALHQHLQETMAGQDDCAQERNDTFIAMAPSPAPGLEPVRKSSNKAKIEHPLDHPLAFGAHDVQGSNQAPARPDSSQAGPTQSGNARYSGGHSNLGSSHPDHQPNQSNHPLASPSALGTRATQDPLSQSANHVTPSNPPNESLRHAVYPVSQRASGAMANVPSQTRSQYAQQTQGLPSHSQSVGSSVPTAQPASRSSFLNVMSSAGNDSVSQRYNNVATPISRPNLNANAPSRYAGQNISSLQSPTMPFPQSPALNTSYAGRGALPGEYGQFSTAPSSAERLQDSGVQQPRTTPMFPPQQSPTPSSNGVGQFEPMQPSSGMPEPLQSANPDVYRQGVPAHGVGGPAGMSAVNMPFGIPQAQGMRSQQVVRSESTEAAEAHRSPLAQQSNHYGSAHDAVSQVGMSAQNGAQYGSTSAPSIPAVAVGAPQGTPAPPNAQYGAVQDTGAGGGVSVQSNSQYVRTQDAKVAAGTSAFDRQGAVSQTNVPAPTSQYRPTPIEGIGIDARSKMSPKQAAEQQILTSAGAPGSAQGRIALLQSALAGGLCKFVVEQVLENPGLSSIKDPAAAKVHSVELLKLLTMDPGYGLKFKLILDEMPAWKKYKSQDHSLFITGAEQKADYFLTDGDKEATKLLTES